MKVVGCTVIYNELNQVLCVSRKTDHTDFGLPGGKMEDEDMSDPRFAACRETEEETGIVLLPSDLTLVYACHHDGFMTYTYMANKHYGEINHNEPHIVKWGSFQDLIAGSFGEYNKNVLDSISDMKKIIHF